MGYSDMDWLRILQAIAAIATIAVAAATFLDLF